MNKCIGFSKMWFLVLLLVAFVAGCASNGDEFVPGKLVSLRVTPPSTTMPVGIAQQYTAIATYNDGSSRDVTADPGTVWSRSNANASLSLNGVAGAGRATGVTATPAGVPVVISAAYRGMAASGNLTVNAAVLQSIAVMPASASIPVGGTQQFTAIATYDFGPSFDVTGTTVWTPANARVTMLGTPGLATGVTANASAVVINASYTAGTVTKTTTANLTVNAAVLQSITVIPGSGTIPVGGTQQFTAIANYDFGPSVDVTAFASWTPANARVSMITTPGLATGVTANAAPVVITASYTAGIVTKSATASLTVNSAVLQSIAVFPASATIPVGGKQQFTAIATYDFGPSIDVTGSVSWTPANARVTMLGAPGLATGVTANVAPVVITASYTAGIVTKTATANLTVNSAVLQSISVIPASASIPVGGTQQFAAIANYDFGPSVDITAFALWSPANGRVTMLGAPGLATGVTANVAPVVITASYTAGTVTKSATANLTVNNAVLQSIAVFPASATTTVGGTQQYTAIATYDFGPSADVTATTIWSPANGRVTMLGAPGLATGVTANVTAVVINASYTAGIITKSTTATLTVTAALVPPSTPGPALSVDLKSTAPYGIIAYDALTNSAGPSHIYGDVALTMPTSTSSSVTGPGFFDGLAALPAKTSSGVTNSTGLFPGLVNTTDNGNFASLPQLLTDLKAVFLNLMGRPVTSALPLAFPFGVGGGTFPPAGEDLSGWVLSPGIYTTIGTYGLSSAKGPLVLDAGGNADAVFIIRSSNAASGLTSTTGSVVLRNGAQSKNVFWVMEDATIGGYTFFQGTVVAGHTITLLSFANVEGRMLAGARGLTSGALTLTSTNVITVPK